MESGDSVLVHSVKAQSRAFTIIAAWLMRRYKWSLGKTMEFLTSRRTDLEIRPSFFYQLTVYEHYLASQGLVTSTWNEITERTGDYENEELLTRNTFLNAQAGPLAALPFANTDSRIFKLKWTDELKAKNPLVVVVEEPIRSKVKNIKMTVKSILKTSRRAKNGGRAASQKPKGIDHSKENEGSRNAIDIYTDIMKQIEGNKPATNKLPVNNSNRMVENTPPRKTKATSYAEPNYIESQYIKKIAKYPIEGFIDISAEENLEANSREGQIKSQVKKVLQSANNKPPIDEARVSRKVIQEKDTESLWMRFSNYNEASREQAISETEERIARLTNKIDNLPYTLNERYELNKAYSLKKQKPETFNTNPSDKYSPLKNTITKVPVKKVITNARPSSAKIRREPSQK